MITPIWKDTNYIYTGSTDPVEYSLTDSTYAVLFTGKAYRKPGADSTVINVNKIVENYLDSSLPDNWSSGVTGTSQITVNSAVGTFNLNIGGTYVSAYTFSNDWSYTDAYTTTGNVLTTPITTDTANGMEWLESTLNSDSVVTVRTDISASTNATSDCYAIYYLQRNGGWASYLIGSNVTKTDEYEKFYTDRSFDNRTLEFETQVYHNQIVTKWKFHTGWLSDEQSDNLAFNLLPSNRMYLHNLYTDEIVPVIVSNESVDYKTYKNQKNKLVSYTIELKNSQKKQLK